MDLDAFHLILGQIYAECKSSRRLCEWNLLGIKHAAHYASGFPATFMNRQFQLDIPVFIRNQENITAFWTFQHMMVHGSPGLAFKYRADPFAKTTLLTD